MVNKVHVKKGDTVYVLTGKDRGKKGKVLTVIPDKMAVIVEGVNIVTKHKKPRSMQQTGGIIHQEAPISSSNVMFFCEKCKKPGKVGRKFLENGEKVRYCKKCGEIIDVVKKANDDRQQ